MISGATEALAEIIQVGATTPVSSDELIAMIERFREWPSKACGAQTSNPALEQPLGRSSSTTRATSLWRRATRGAGSKNTPIRDGVLFLLLWVPYALLVRRFWFVTDDAYISFRYARNLAWGHGLRYNLGSGPPVEGYSNFLWTLYAALVERLRGDVTFWAPLTSFLCGTALLWLVWRVLLRRFDLSTPVAFAATLSLGCFPPFALWSTGGLETMPFALALFATFERLALRRAGPDALGAVLAGLALALLRFEGVAWAALVAALAAVARRIEGRPFARPLAAYAAVVGAGYGAYWLWRFSYYGLALPNDAYAKLGLSAKVIRTGLDYLAVHWLTFLAPFLLVPSWIVAMRRRWLGPGISVSAVSLATLLYPVLVGGDFMAMGRLLVPGLAFGTVLLAFLLQTLWERSTAARGLALFVAASGLVVGLAPAWNIDVVPRGVRRAFSFRRNFGEDDPRSEYEQWRYMDENTKTWRIKGLALKQIAPAGSTVVANSIGCVGYYSDLFVWDRNGLVSHEVAMRKNESPYETSPGHHKLVPNTFFLDRAPTFLAVELFTSGDLRAEVVRWAWIWHGWADGGRYAPDFFAAGAQGRTPAYALLVLRRLDPDADRELAWAAFWDRVAKFDWSGLEGASRALGRSPAHLLPSHPAKLRPGG
jgi:arabinofuranosyltransferase